MTDAPPPQNPSFLPYPASKSADAHTPTIVTVAGIPNTAKSMPRPASSAVDEWLDQALEGMVRMQHDSEYAAHIRGRVS